jgi:hypothetical protein
MTGFTSKTRRLELHLGTEGPGRQRQRWRVSSLLRLVTWAHRRGLQATSSRRLALGPEIPLVVEIAAARSFLSLCLNTLSWILYRVYYAPLLLRRNLPYTHTKAQSPLPGVVARRSSDVSSFRFIFCLVRQRLHVWNLGLI